MNLTVKDFDEILLSLVGKLPPVEVETTLKLKQFTLYSVFFPQFLEEVVQLDESERDKLTVIFRAALHFGYRLAQKEEMMKDE